MKIRLCFMGVLILLLSTNLFADENNISDETVSTTEQAVVVRSVDYEIDGKTRVFALRNASEIKGGERFPSKDAFEKWVAEKKQILTNERVLESVEIEVSFGEKELDGSLPAYLKIKVKDTWNIIVLPKPQYDSNDGFELTLKGRDYNFLGTMEPLRIDFGYELEPSPFSKGEFQKGSFVTDIDSNIPFYAFGYDWKIDFDHTLTYVFDEPLEYKNKTGVSIDFPIRATTLTIGVFQGLSINEENGDDYKEEYGDRYEDIWYLSSSLEASWNIPTGFKIDGIGKLSYVPRLIVKNKYRPGGSIGEERRGPTIEPGHALSFGRIDWMGNFRRGLEITLDNANVYNFNSRSWDKNVTAKVIGHLPLTSFFGVSGRLSGIYYFDDPDDEAGSYLRGILDDAVVADYGLFLNLDFPVRIINFRPSKWLDNRKLRIFDFEQQWSPFIDIGLVDDNENGRPFTIQHALVTSGLEAVTFPLSMRSLYIRISFEFNLRKAIKEKSIPSGDNREIFIGIGHHY